MDKKWVLLGFIVLLLLGCVTETKPKKGIEPRAEIVSLEFNGETYSLKLKSNQSLKKTRIELLGNENELLCFDYADLKKGLNELEMNCPLSETVLVEVTPDRGRMVSKKTTGLLENLKSGGLTKGKMLQYKVDYSNKNEPVFLDLYVLDENSSEWSLLIVSITPVNHYDSKSSEMFVGFYEARLFKEDLSYETKGWLSRKNFVEGTKEFRKELNEKEDLVLRLPLPLSYLKKAFNERLDIDKLFKEKETVLFETRLEVLRLTIIDDHYSVRVTETDEKTGALSGDFFVRPNKPFPVIKASFPGVEVKLLKLEDKEFDLNEYKDFPSFEALGWE